MKKQLLLLYACVFISPIICSDYIPLTLNTDTVNTDIIDTLKTNLIHNINQVRDLNNEVNSQLSYVYEENNLNEENIETLLIQWNNAKNSFEEIKEQKLNIEKKYPALFQKSNYSCSSYFRTFFTSTLDSELYKPIGTLDIIHIPINSFLGSALTTGVCLFQNLIYNGNLNFIAPALIEIGIGASTRIVGIIYKNKKVKDLLHEHPEYPIIAKALKNIYLKKIEL